MRREITILAGSVMFPFARERSAQPQQSTMGQQPSSLSMPYLILAHYRDKAHLGTLQEHLREIKSPQDFITWTNSEDGLIYVAFWTREMEKSIGFVVHQLHWAYPERAPERGLFYISLDAVRKIKAVREKKGEEERKEMDRFMAVGRPNPNARV